MVRHCLFQIPHYDLCLEGGRCFVARCKERAIFRNGYAGYFLIDARVEEELLLRRQRSQYYYRSEGKDDEFATWRVVETASNRAWSCFEEETRPQVEKCCLWQKAAKELEMNTYH